MSPMNALHRQPERLAPRDSAGDGARERLLLAGLRLFAERGFAATSTRELAELAGVNVASIAYYFGDKAGLYRATIVEPMGSADDDIALYADPQLTLAQALSAFYRSLLEPLRQGEINRLCMKLHFREMLEPTGVFEQEIVEDIRRMHEALVQLLCRALGLGAADDALLRLAICLAAPGVHLHTARDVTERIVPGLMDGDAALRAWQDQLVHYGLAMVEAERARRAA